jgi:hypothetical protein
VRTAAAIAKAPRLSTSNRQIVSCAAAIAAMMRVGRGALRSNGRSIAAGSSNNAKSARWPTLPKVISWKRLVRKRAIFASPRSVGVSGTPNLST